MENNSNSLDIDDGFRLIKGRMKIKRKYRNKLEIDESNGDTNIDHQVVVRRLQELRNNIKTCTYFKNLLTKLEKSLQYTGQKTINEFVCFGIGSFSSNIAALHQLALSIELRDHLKISSSLYYDPIFSAAEVDILNLSNCPVMESNCEGKYSVGDQCTLLYFPHCPKQLTNNFLWKNWNLNKLQKSLLLCNSFEKIIDSTPHRILCDEVKYIVNIMDFVKEFPLDNCYVYEDIFNDISIHVFVENPSVIPDDFWIRQDEPKYCDMELITNKLTTNLKISGQNQ